MNQNQNIGNSQEDCRESVSKVRAAKKDFFMSKENFKQVQSLAYEHCGISLSDAKEEMVYSRLSKRLRDLDISSFDTYCEMVNKNQRDETGKFINAITTNLTSFFRENHHFEFLKSELIPNLRTLHSGDQRIRAWSAGCSTGEEPYSIAMVLNESFAHLQDWDIKILASDLDTDVLRCAEEGIYTLKNSTGISEQRLKRFFRKSIEKGQTKIQTRDEIKRLITFNQLNLMQSWPMKGMFDFIFCRNVVIYFDKPTQRKLFERYANLLRPGGLIFIGHSESLHGVTSDFKSIGKTIYRRV